MLPLVPPVLLDTPLSTMDVPNVRPTVKLALTVPLVVNVTLVMLWLKLIARNVRPIALFVLHQRIVPPVTLVTLSPVVTVLR